MLSDSDRQALGHLVHTHQAMVRAFLVRFVADADVLDDLVQETFVGVLPRCRALADRPDDESAAYLRGVARNLVRQRWRRQAREGLSPITELLHDQLEADLDADPLDLSERLAVMRRCLDALPEKARHLVDGHYAQNQPILEIARACGRSASAMRMQLHRTRQRLRDCVERRLGGEALS